MNRTEERLSDALQAFACTVRPEHLRPVGDPVPAPDRDAPAVDTPALARPAGAGPGRHRRWLVPLAAAAAAVLVAGLSLLAGNILHGPATAPGPASMPRYYLVYRSMPGGSASGDEVIEVRDTATGRVRDTFDLTRKLGGQPGVHFVGPGILTAAADQRTFFVDFPLWKPRTKSVNGARIFRFQVSGSGKVTDVRQVGLPAGTGLPAAMAVSPDGDRLALALYDERTQSALRPAVMVVNLATGATTRWHGGLAGQQYQNAITQLSWSGDGHTLAFRYVHDMSAPTAPSGDPSQWTTEVRTLNTDAPGGTLDAGRLIFRVPMSKSRFIVQAVITADGRSIIMAVQQGPIYKYSGLPGTVEVIQVSVRDGRQLRVLYQGPAGNSTSPFLRSDGAGHWLLTANWKLGWIGGGRLHNLPPGQDGTVTDVAW